VKLTNGLYTWYVLAIDHFLGYNNNNNSDWKTHFLFFISPISPLIVIDIINDTKIIVTHLQTKYGYLQKP
jgi:hypothetical protein